MLNLHGNRAQLQRNRCSTSPVSLRKLNGIRTEGQNTSQNIRDIKHSILGTDSRVQLTEEQESLFITTEPAVSLTKEESLNRINICKAIVQNIVPCDSWADVSQASNIRQFIIDCKATLEQARKIQDNILKQYKPEIFGIDYISIIRRYKTNYGSIFHHFRADYKEDVKTIHGFQRDVNMKTNDDSMRTLLKKFSRYNKAHKWINENHQYIDSYIMYP